MADPLSIAASAVGVADFGLKLSFNLYNFAKTTANADKSIKEIALKVEVTAAAIKHVGDVFGNPENIARSKTEAFETAKTALGQCNEIFKEIKDQVEKSKKNKLLFYFKTAKFDQLNNSLEASKSTLVLLMHVLQNAQQLAIRADMREEAQELIRARKEVIERLRRQPPEETEQTTQPLLSRISGEREISSRKISGNVFNSNSTLTADPNQHISDESDYTVATPLTGSELILTPSTVFFAAEMRPGPHVDPPRSEFQGAAEPSVTNDELEKCLQMLKQMVSNVEMLQKYLQGSVSTAGAVEILARTTEFPEHWSKTKENLDGLMKKCEKGGHVKARDGSAESILVDQGNSLVQGNNFNNLSGPTEASKFFFQAAKLGQAVLGKADDLAVDCATATVDSLEGVKADSRNNDVTRKEEMLKYVADTEKCRHGTTSALATKYNNQLAQPFTDIKENDKAEAVYRDVYKLTIAQNGVFSQEATQNGESAPWKVIRAVWNFFSGNGDKNGDGDGAGNFVIQPLSEAGPQDHRSGSPVYSARPRSISHDSGVVADAPTHGEQEGGDTSLDISSSGEMTEDLKTLLKEWTTVLDTTET